MISAFRFFGRVASNFLFAPKTSDELDFELNLSKNKRIIELYEGVLKSERVKSKNIISSRVYTNLDFFPIVLLKLFEQTGLIINLVIILIERHINTDSSTLDNKFNIKSENFFYIFISFYLLKNLFLEYQNHKQDQIKNKKDCIKIVFEKDRIKFYHIKWQDVQVGDFILLRRNEKSPADILIFDSKNQICHVDTASVNGSSKLFPKQPLNQTSFGKNPNFKKNFENYRKILSGKITVEREKKKVTSNGLIKGFIKLDKDPKIENLNEKNVIFRESLLKKTDWAFGMVINVGEECLIASQKKNNLRKTYYFHKFLNINICVFFLLVILMSLFCSLCTDYYLNKHKDHPFYPAIFESHSAFTQTLVFAIKIINVFYYFFVEFATLFEKIRIEALFKKRIYIRNPDVLPSLKQIGSVIIDKNRTIMKNSKIISGIVTPSRIYQISSRDDIKQVRSHLLNSLEVSLRNNKKLTTLEKFSQMRESEIEASLIPNENNDVSIRFNRVELKENCSPTPIVSELLPSPLLPSTNPSSQLPLVLSSSALPTPPAIPPLSSPTFFASNSNNPPPSSLPPIFSEMSPSTSSLPPPSALPHSSIPLPSSGPPLPSQPSSLNPLPSILQNNYRRGTSVVGTGESFRKMKRRITTTTEESDRKRNTLLGMTGNTTITFVSNKNEEKEEGNNVKVYKLRSLRTKGERMTSKFKVRDENMDSELSFKEIIFDESDLKMIFKTLLLSHETKTKWDPQKMNFIHQTFPNYSECVLDFCRECGAKFLGGYRMDIKQNSKKRNVYEIELERNQPELLKILSVNQETINRKRMSILISNSLDESSKSRKIINIPKQIEEVPEEKWSFGSTLYITGKDPSDMIGILNLQNKEKMLDKLEGFTEKGETCIFYAKKWISEAETEAFLKRSKTIKTSLTINEDELEDLYNKLEDNAEFVCIVALKEDLRNGVDLLLDKFLKSNMRIALVSGDDEFSTLINGFQCKLIQGASKLFKINASNESQALISLKYILQKLNKNGQEDNPLGDTLQNESPSENLLFSKKITFSIRSLTKEFMAEEIIILMKGESFLLIYNNRYLRQHLLFLMIFSKIVMYESTSESKQKLAKMLKKIDHSTNKTVLGIADGFDDILFLEECDVGVEIQQFEVEEGTEEEREEEEEVGGREEEEGGGGGGEEERRRKEDREGRDEGGRRKEEETFWTGKETIFTTGGDLGGRKNGKREGRREVICNRGDVIVSEFRDIGELIYRRGCGLFDRMEEMLYFLFFVVFTLLLCYFYYEWFSLFTHNEMISPSDFEMMVVAMVLNGIITYFWFEDDEKTNLTFFLPQVYFLLMRDKKFEFKKLLFKCFGPAILTVSITFFLLLFFTTEYEGTVLPFIFFKGKTHFCFFVTFYIKILTFSSKIRWPLVIGILFFIFSLTFYFQYYSIRFFDFRPHSEFELNETVQPSCSWYVLVFAILGASISNEVSTLLLNWLGSHEQRVWKVEEVLRDDGGKANRVNEVLRQEIYMINNINTNFKSIIKKILNTNKMDPIINEIINPATLNTNKILYNKYTLKLNDNKIQLKFDEFESKFMNIRKKINLLFLLVLIGALSFDVFYWLHNRLLESNIVLGAALSLILLFFIFSLVKYSVFSKYGDCSIVLSFLLYFVVFYAIEEIHLKDLPNLNKLFLQITAIGIFLFLHLKNILAFIAAFAIILIGTYSNVLRIDMNNHLNTSESIFFEGFWKIICGLAIFMIFIISIFEKRHVEEEKLQIFLNEENLIMEKKKVNDILSLLVPKFIKDLMYQGNFAVSEDQSDICVLFADISDFEKITTEEDNNLIHLLDSLFRIFDQLCNKNNIQKIETVGKTYMACSGLRECEMGLRMDRGGMKSSADRIVALALDMIKYASHHTWGQNGNNIKLKIGIHNGPVIAGVIGYHKPQFSLIGDTINTTSRVCSTSEPNIVTISEQIYNLITKNLDFTYKERKVNAKGKGELITYQVLKSHNFDSLLKTIKNDGPVSQLEIKQSPERNLSEKIKMITSKNAQELNDIDRKSKFKRKTQLNKLTQIINPPNKPLHIPLPSSPPPSKFASSIPPLGVQPSSPYSTPPPPLPGSPSHPAPLPSFNSNPSSLLPPITQQILPSSNSHRNFSSVRPLQPLGTVPPSSPKSLSPAKKDLAAMEGNGENENPESKISKTLNKTKKIIKNLIFKTKVKLALKKDDNSERAGLSQSSSLDLIDDYHHQSKEINGRKVEQCFEIIEVNPIVQTERNAFFRQCSIKNIKKTSSSQQKIGLAAENLDETSIWNKNADSFLLKVKNLWLAFSASNETIEEFNLESLERNWVIDSLNLALFLFYNLLFGFMMLTIQNYLKDFTVLISIRLTTALFGILTSKYVMRQVRGRRRCLMAGLYFVFLVQIVLFALLNRNVFLIPEIEGLLFYYSFSRFSFYYLNEQILLALLSLALHSILLAETNNDVWCTLWSSACVIGFNLIGVHTKIWSRIRHFNNSRANVVKKRQLNNLVSHLLPVHILEKFVDKNNSYINNDYFENVTILFADIVNFTKYSSNVTPIEVVNMLRDLFTEFDKMTLHLDVFKLYTIGDCYVVMGLVNAHERDYFQEAKNTVLMGFAMIEGIRELHKKDQSYAGLDMRIGIHTGNIIGGIVGTDIVRYDIYGKDVYIANKMESNSLPSQVLISERTFQLLQAKYDNEFNFEVNKMVELPISGEFVNSHFVTLKNEFEESKSEENFD